MENQSNNNNQEVKRLMLRNELDFQLALSNTTWGGGEISQELKEKLTNSYGYIAPDGKTIITTKDSLWAMLGFYTRDLRLGNLSKWDNEVAYCDYYLKLANNYLFFGETEAFLISLSNVINLLELSQSRGGFFRRRSNTLTQEHFSQELEPEKKNFFSRPKRD